MADPLFVINVGMVTAVGLTAPETAASVRSATARFFETSICDQRFEPFTLAEVFDDGLPELEASIQHRPGPTARDLRIVRLAAQPLIEALAVLPATSPRLGLMLAVPDSTSPQSLDGPGLLQLLDRQTGGAFDVRLSDASFVGRTGGLQAIRRAAENIRTGRVGMMLVGGTDTYRDLNLLAGLDFEGRVKSSSHLDGFIPGEAAAFLLIASEGAARAARIDPVASLGPVVSGFEDGHLYSEQPYRGDGLAATIQQLSPASRQPIREIYSSMNGENHWAKEWGVAYIRNRALFAEDFAIHHPADCFGDTGAACGPAMVGLAALGIARGYRESPTLVYCSSDRGDRAAVIVESA
jgi:3-oxoacyl-[acyl-carrier-protein] synthase-1